jgi:serine/threonine protein kinase
MKFAHPGVIRVLGMDATLLRLENVTGTNLRRVMSRSPIPLRAALAIVRDVLDALVALHAAGFVHRRLEPSTIYVVRDPATRIKIHHPRVLDLAALALNGARYRAPERDPDGRADVYSLAMIAEELLDPDPPRALVAWMAHAGSADRGCRFATSAVARDALAHAISATGWIPDLEALNPVALSK